MKRKQLIYAGAALALGIGAYLLLFKKPAPAPEPAPLPPAPDGGPLLPPSSTPAPAPAPQVLTIGDKVAATTNAPMFDKNNFARYRAGGSDGKGNIETGKFAGTIIGLKKGSATGTNYAVLLGYQYAPKNTAGVNVYEYLIPTAALTKI